MYALLVLWFRICECTKPVDEVLIVRTEEKVNEELASCKAKRDFWKIRFSNLVVEEFEGQRREYEDNYRIWAERVKTLEYVLGLRDVL